MTASTASRPTARAIANRRRIYLGEKLRVAPVGARSLNLDEARELGPDRIHPRLALSAADRGDDARQVTAAAQLVDRGHLAHLLLQQRSHRGPPLVRCVELGEWPRFPPCCGDLVTLGQIRGQKGLVAGESETALPGLCIDHCAQPIFGAAGEGEDSPVFGACGLQLTQNPEGGRGAQGDEQDGAGQYGGDLTIGSHGAKAGGAAGGLAQVTPGRSSGASGSIGASASG